MTEIAQLLGVLAGAIGVADMIPYVRDILRGTTRPHRGTWLIWGALAIVVCFSQRANGASWSLIMAATGALLNSLIFALSIRCGVGGVTAVELVMTVVTGGGVVGWLVADERSWRRPVSSVGSADLSLLLYPVYYCLITGAIALLIYHRRAVLACAIPHPEPALPPPHSRCA